MPLPRNSKWAGLKRPRSYEIVDLGRAATFFLPIRCLFKEVDGKTVESILHEFLSEWFGGVTRFATVPSVGIWRNAQEVMVLDECRPYKVAFLGKRHLPSLMAELARICELVGEDCVYFEAGQYTCLIYPPRSKKSPNRKKGKKK